MKHSVLNSLLACLLSLGAVTAWAQASGDATDPDWGQLRRDVDAGGRGPHANGDFEARRQAIRERARARFAEADRNGDGLLSREEAAQLRPMLARHFDRIDTNRDGQASEQELANALRRLQQLRRDRFNGPAPRAPLR